LLSFFASASYWEKTLTLLPLPDSNLAIAIPQAPDPMILTFEGLEVLVLTAFEVLERGFFIQVIFEMFLDQRIICRSR
jgi:hypothetical protein